MRVIPFNRQPGIIYGLEIKSASDGAGTYALVVALDDANH
jgi:hypothetical protein